ncbi:MAG: T9SS type A sorting domain-containing protein [Flavobacterium sp.]
MVSEVKIQSDSKIMVLVYGFVPVYGLIRYNADGSRDTTYGNAGAVFGLPNTDTYMRSMTLLNDDRVVLIGLINDMQNSNSFALLRHLPSGALDPTFGNGGMVLYPQIQITANGLLLQEDNKLVFGGNTQNGNDSLYTVGRFNADGTIDNTFGTNGITTTDVTPSYNRLNAIAFQNDGKLVAVGDGACITLARYTQGTLSDRTFSSNNLQMAVYPNPAPDAFHLTYELKNNQTVSATLHDLYGRGMRKPIENQQQIAGKHIQPISLEGLSTGTYLLVLETSEGKQCCKVIKSN